MKRDGDRGEKNQFFGPNRNIEYLDLLKNKNVMLTASRWTFLSSNDAKIRFIK